MSYQREYEEYSLSELDKLYNEYGIDEETYNELVKRFEKFRGQIDGYQFYETPLIDLEKEYPQKGGKSGKGSKGRKGSKSGKSSKGGKGGKGRKDSKTRKSRKLKKSRKVSKMKKSRKSRK
jgi:hypothetical protein